MAQVVYEFPLNEKVRGFLRLEQLFRQLNHNKTYKKDWQFITFFETLFTLLDLMERVDLRTDIVKDIDAHEKNLLYWSQHPKIDNDALQQTLKRIINLRDKLKSAGKPGIALKEDRFLMSIRQRFSIPGGTCSFDLPNLHYWLQQPKEQIQQSIDNWMKEFELIQDAIEITLSFLREKGRFEDMTAENGFYQGVADDKHELIRVYCATDKGYFPTLSGNKYRYAIRFMLFAPDDKGQTAVETTTSFKLACC